MPMANVTVLKASCWFELLHSKLSPIRTSPVVKNFKSSLVLDQVNYPVAEPRGIFKNQKLTAYCHDTLYIALLPLPLPHPQHSLQNTHHSKTPLPKAPLSPLEIP